MKAAFGDFYLGDQNFIIIKFKYFIFFVIGILIYILIFFFLTTLVFIFYSFIS